MALIMAIALWIYAINRHTGDIKEDIQLTINAPPGLTILDTSSDMVTVGLSGPQNTIERISDMIKDEKIKARFDMPDIGVVDDDNYKKTIHLTRRNFNFPQEIRLNSIVPNEIEITLGRLESKYISNNNWEYTVTGDLPNPCYKATVDATVAESYPEQVTVTVTTTAPSGDEMCAQVIQEFSYEGTFSASDKAVIDFEVK